MASSTSTTVFHERQRWLRCGLHAVNNVLQEAKATPEDFERIAASHAHIAGKGPVLFRLGFGDYDGNTIIEFLQNRASCEVTFVDRRHAAETIRQQIMSDNNNLKGFLVNVRRRKSLVPSFIYTSRHWFSVVRVGEKDWYLVDSSKDQVEKINDPVSYLANLQNDEHLDANLIAVTDFSSADKLQRN
eukprot:scaffold31046_cov157-Amphora_coffeaeformis.AAC.4